jgi:four helix bundle protein
LTRASTTARSGVASDGGKRVVRCGTAVEPGGLARLSDRRVVLGCVKDACGAAASPRLLGRFALSQSLTQPARDAVGRAPYERRGAERETEMMRIYDTVLQVVGALRPVMVQIEAHDRDLARQLRRAAASVALNVSEGSGSSGGTRRERYRNALGSARETGACLDVAVALGYVEHIDARLLDALDKVRATLVKVAL